MMICGVVLVLVLVLTSTVISPNGPLRDLRRSRRSNVQLKDGRIYSEITGLADNEDPRDVETHF